MQDIEGRSRAPDSGMPPGEPDRIALIVDDLSCRCKKDDTA